VAGVSETNNDSQTIEARGHRLFAQEKYKETAECFLRAQRAYAEAGDELKAAEMLNNIGVAYRRGRKHKEAASALEEARQAFARLGDQQREAQTLGNLGGLYSKMKRYDEAQTCFQAAVDLFGQLDDRGRQAETLRAMAIMQFKRGQRSEALTTYEHGLYFLPNPTFLQRLLRFLLKLRGWLMNLSPFR
jgi:tetratricopeptide (TPR) repeat protein